LYIGNATNSQGGQGPYWGRQSWHIT